jgi:beta-glucosidase-like glycosyl hydrolase/CubicO group peptidase (beta-lactamase class C family)
MLKQNKLRLILVGVGLSLFAWATWAAWLQWERKLDPSEDAAVHAPVPLPGGPAMQPPFLPGTPEGDRATAWADSVMKTLTLPRMIAQLVMPAVYSEKERGNGDLALKWCRELGIGGVISMQGGPAAQRALVQRLQAASAIPLLVTFDGEWGLSMRLDSTHGFPRALTLGASDDSILVREMGRSIARDLKAIGVHVNFAPDVDVNSNPDNPVIGYRSFGEDPLRVSRLGTAYALGLQDERVLATAKHFPGHGDTDSDSHATLPTVAHDRKRLDEVELVPFHALQHAGVGAMMAAHLYIPALDTASNRPSTLSPRVIGELLRGEMGYRGLVFTDAMNMKGFSDYKSSPSPSVDALLAGNDVLLFPDDPFAVVEQVMAAVREGRLDSLQIAEKCRRVLQAKSWTQAPLPLPDVRLSDLEETPAREALHTEILASALTVVKNDEEGLPMRAGAGRVVVASAGAGTDSDVLTPRLRQILGSGADVKSLSLESATAALSSLGASDWVVVALRGTDRRVSKNYGVTPETWKSIGDLCAAGKAKAQGPRVAVVIFGSPYLLDRAKGALDSADAILVAYEDDARAQKVAAAALAGAGRAGGHLPVSAGGFPCGHGLPWAGDQRLGWSDVPFSGSATIDSIARVAIASGATPGCRVVVAHRGKIIHDGCYGTTDGTQPVEPGTLYDLASITKIASSTLAMMSLEDRGSWNRKQPVATHLPQFQSSEIGRKTYEEILSHQAGLPPILPLAQRAESIPGLLAAQSDAEHSWQVARSLYVLPSMRDTILDWIRNLKLEGAGSMKYSDLGYYLIQQTAEKITGKPLDAFVEEWFYAPMGLHSMGYRPLERFEIQQIAPTERETTFRKQLIHGHVHDPGAALMGGVAGHAGLFSDAYDLARLMHMFNRGGCYADAQWISPATLEAWTSPVSKDVAKNRKGVGFDRPTPKHISGPTCSEVSSKSFGHTGFTGTIAWADPEHDLVYIFLSNRVYPTAENKLLLQRNVRTEIQRTIYRSLGIS